MPGTSEKISSFAVSMPDDDMVWEAMTREQQLSALQALFNHPDATTPCDLAVGDIVRKARAARTSSDEPGSL